MTPIDWLSLQHLRALGFRGRHVSTRYGRQHVLHARGRGPLPPVVLVHGLSSRGSHYRRLVRHLLPHVQSITLPDMPGHGLSDVPEVGMCGESVLGGFTELMDATLERPALLFGNSLGGYGVLKYARLRPERTLGVVVNAPGGGEMGDVNLQRFLDRFRVRNHDEAVAMAERVFAKLPGPKPLVAWAVRRQLDKPVVRDFLARMHTDDTFQPHELSELQMPISMLWGVHERVMLRRHLDFFKAHLPDHAETHEPHNYGHSPYLEQSRDLSERILDFARRLPG